MYGNTTLGEILDHLGKVASQLDVSLKSAQSNSEGELIDTVHSWRSVVDGVIVNAGAYTHTSLALRDAFLATGIPFVEVHLTNIHAREPERRHSMLASASLGMVCGLGAAGYEYALRGLVNVLKIRQTA